MSSLQRSTSVSPSLGPLPLPLLLLVRGAGFMHVHLCVRMCTECLLAKTQSTSQQLLDMMEARPGAGFAANDGARHSVRTPQSLPSQGRRRGDKGRGERGGGFRGRKERRNSSESEGCVQEFELQIESPVHVKVGLWHAYNPLCAL